jgi:hypothetical protein
MTQQTWPNRPSGRCLHNLPEPPLKVRLGLTWARGPTKSPSWFFSQNSRLGPWTMLGFFGATRSPLGFEDAHDVVEQVRRRATSAALHYWGYDSGELRWTRRGKTRGGSRPDRFQEKGVRTRCSMDFPKGKAGQQNSPAVRFGCGGGAFSYTKDTTARGPIGNTRLARAQRGLVVRQRDAVQRCGAWLLQAARRPGTRRRLRGAKTE